MFLNFDLQLEFVSTINLHVHTKNYMKAGADSGGGGGLHLFNYTFIVVVNCIMNIDRKNLLKYVPQVMDTVGPAHMAALVASV